MVSFTNTKYDFDAAPRDDLRQATTTVFDPVPKLQEISLGRRKSTDRVKRDDPFELFKFNDPIFRRQWHLHNRQNSGNDINVTPVWKKGITGKGVVVCIIDDGIDHTHADIKRAFRADLSWDFNEKVQIPVPKVELNDRHGTRCAGLIAGEANNGVCGVGVAYDAQVSAVRILSRKLSTNAEASAVVHKYHENHIYSCSWGPADDGKALDGPPSKVLRAFIDGLMNGRNGLGSIYVFASGNGKCVDNCNYDGYANGVFSVTIGAIDCNNAMPVYMEPCAAQLAVTYSSGYERKIATTDLGGDSCTMKHGGTSAAAPLAAGIFALVLQARPDLTWRDLQWLVIESAVRIASLDPSWTVNGAGKAYSQKFGFGKIDAAKLVDMSESWKLVGKPMVISLPTKELRASIPIKNQIGLVDTIEINARMHAAMGMDCISRLEHVTVTVDIEHPCRGELQLFLRSPSGTVVQLATSRPLDESDKGLRGWTFMSVGYWGETLVRGPWTLNVVNKRHEGPSGTIVSWRLGLWGEQKESCPFDKQSYMDAFHAIYHPPTPDHFSDTQGLFRKAALVQSAPGPQNSNILPWLVLGCIAIAVIVQLFTRKTRRYTPVARSGQVEHL